MGLFNPRPGEIIDRMTILDLKIHHGQKKGVETTHFEAEKAQCQEGLRDWEGGLSESFYFYDEEEYDDHMNRINAEKNNLQCVNALLWDAEDKIRAVIAKETNETPASAFELAALCRSVATWNDARARHIRELNRLYDAGEENEKLHDSVMNK